MVLNLFDNPEFFYHSMIWAHLFCCKNDLHTFLLQKLFMHLFCHKKNLRALFFVAKTIYSLFFVAKTIYALSPESFCALKVAIRKVQTFWASEGLVGILFKTGGRFTFFGCIFWRRWSLQQSPMWMLHSFEDRHSSPGRINIFSGKYTKNSDTFYLFPCPIPNVQYLVTCK